MPCLSVEELASYASGGSGGDRMRIDVHIETCEHCRAAVAAMVRARRPAAIGTGPTIAAGSQAPTAVDRAVEFAPTLDPTGHDLAATGLVEVDAAHYEIARELARGGMGRIRVALDHRLGRMVAIKDVLVPGGPLALRFEREARITARLQHPSIVSVYEAGKWPTGEPFYAMPLIKGQSLDAAIAERDTLDRRLALVPHVLAVADAIAYAHGERVIHRDLKPRNILVGTFGETVVIDWGLAKDRSAVDDVTAARAGDGLETEAGEVMGTPAYMPPEQANGDPVDERADVYAIGALFAHVLTGKPPYTGGSTAEIIAAVLEGPPPPVSEREPGTPIELVAIIERAMARDPAQRYPTARELAEDLRRFQTGQLVGAHHYTRRQLAGRWLARHRAATLAALAITVVAAVSVQRVVHARQIADAERDRAEASRNDAEDLLGFMVGDLRAKLSPIGRVEVLDAVARKAVGYYERHATGLGIDERGKRGDELEALGEVLTDEGAVDEARRQYRAALGIFAGLLVVDPGNPAWRARAGDLHAQLGIIAQAQGDTAGALAELTTAVTMLDNVARANPLRFDHQLGIALQSHGDALVRRGDSKAALGDFQRMATLADGLVAREASAANLELRQAAHERLADWYANAGDGKRAIAENSIELGAAEALFAVRKDGAAESMVAMAHDHLALSRRIAADPNAIDETAKSREIWERLVARDPANARWALGYLACLQRRGEMENVVNKVDDALVDFRTELAMVEAHHVRDPSDVQWTAASIASHSNIADVLVKRGEPRKATDEHRAAERAVAALVAKDPNDTRWEQGQAALQYRIGDDLVVAGDGKAAAAELTTAIDEYAALLAKDPRNMDWQNGMLDTRADLVHAYVVMHDYRGAIEQGKLTEATIETLRAKIHDDPGLVDIAADVHGWLGEAHDGIGDRAGARAEYAIALDGARKIAAAMPDDPAQKARVARFAAKR